MKHCRFDAVLIHQSVWLWTIVARSVKKAAVPLIFWHYDNHIAERWLEWWAGFVKPDFAICISAFAQSGLSRLFPGTRSAVVCCPVALDEMRGRRDRRTGLRRSFNTPTDACVIVQVGRFARHKGHFILFDALSAMREFSNWVCWQVGAPQLQEESDYLGAMKRKAHALGIEDRIRFLGHREDIPDVLAAADIYCQPNTSPEGYGLTFIEALNNGMPVVTSGIGGAVDIIDGSGCGLLVEPGDVAGLAGALTRLVHDSALRTAIGQCGPSRAARLSDCTQQMEQIAATIKLVVNG